VAPPPESGCVDEASKLPADVHDVLEDVEKHMNVLG
jgi:hypothetical protein